MGLKSEEDIVQNVINGPTSHLQYHDPLEYDYGDYLEGYQNYVKPQRPKSVSERIAKWFAGFKIPSAKPVSENSPTAKNVVNTPALDSQVRNSLIDICALRALSARGA